MDVKKNDTDLVKSDSSKSPFSFSLTEAKRWFTDNIRNTTAPQNSEVNELFSNAIPDWSKATNTQDKDWYVIELPIRFNKSIGFDVHAVGNVESKPSNKKTSLVILKHKKNGNLRSVLMHLASTSETNLQKINYANKENFNGTVLYTTLNGMFLNGWVYENGKVKAAISKKKENLASRVELPGDECTTIQIDWYEQTCTYYSNNTEICSGWTYTHTTYQTICTGDGSSGGGGSGGPAPEEIPIKRLCGGYSFAVIGNSYTGSIKYLQQIWQNTDYHYQSFTTNFIESCLTIPNYGISPTQASEIFNTAVNDASRQVLNELNAALIPYTAIAVQLRLKTLIQTKLAYLRPGSVWNTNICGGNIPSTEASWCQ